MLPDLIEQQQEEIERLREHVRQLEDLLLPMRFLAPVEWRLTASEARLFAFLASRDMATKQQIMDALYQLQAGDQPEIKIVDVFVCKLRKKVKPFGVIIETHWGQGYGVRDRNNYAAKLAA